MNAADFEVARDLAGLRLAAGDILQEEYDAKDIERQEKKLGRSADPQRLLESLAPRRRVSPGYYDRVHYLLELEATLKMGVQIPESKISAFEVRGIAVVQMARLSFLREHPSCPQCGELNFVAATFCRGCKKTLKPKAGAE